MKLLICLLIASFSAVSFASDEWQTAPGRIAMLNAGSKIRAGYPSVHLIGLSDKGRICELSISGKNMSIDNGKGLDGVFNPYWALMKDGSAVPVDSDITTANAIREITVSVTSTIDQSSAMLTVRFDTKHMTRANGKDVAPDFIGGEFVFDRGGNDKTICSLKARAFGKRDSDWPITIGEF